MPSQTAPFASDAVAHAFDTFPTPARKRLLELREIIGEVASNEADCSPLSETLKWGQPSYLSPVGSTVRLGTMSAHPEYVAVFFTCSTRLVTTFKMVFNGAFIFEANRAILIPIKGDYPKQELEGCLVAALRYQKVKDLPTLGL